jgi:hypothetical protein
VSVRQRRFDSQESMMRLSSQLVLHITSIGVDSKMIEPHVRALDFSKESWWLAFVSVFPFCSCIECFARTLVWMLSMSLVRGDCVRSEVIRWPYMKKRLYMSALDLHIRITDYLFESSQVRYVLDGCLALAENPNFPDQSLRISKSMVYLLEEISLFKMGSYGSIFECAGLVKRIPLTH